MTPTDRKPKRYRLRRLALGPMQQRGCGSWGTCAAFAPAKLDGLCACVPTSRRGRFWHWFATKVWWPSPIYRYWEDHEFWWER